MSGKSGYVINLHGGGFERVLDKGFRTAEELAAWVASRTDDTLKSRIDVVRVRDLNATMDMIHEKGGAMARFALRGEKVLESIPGMHFVTKKADLVLKIGGAAIGFFGASGSAFAATGDFNQAARAGAAASSAQLNEAVNPGDRSSRAWHNISGGVSELAHGQGRGLERLSAGLSSGLESAATVLGLEGMANWAEKDRVLPAATRILETQGADALTRQIIRLREDPKYIVMANASLPDEYNGKPMAEALKDDKVYRNYEHALERRIGASTGEQREMWQGQLDTIQGYREALNAEAGTPMPRPAQALGMRFN